MGGKKSKIALTLLQKPKKQGGLNLFDLRLKEIAIKSTWVKIINDDPKVSHFASEALQVKVGENMWSANLNISDIRLNFPKGFWRDVLESWAVTNYGRDPPEQQMLWYNSDIRIDNKIFCWGKQYNKGLVWVCQLMTNGMIISVQEAKEQFDLNFMQLYQLWDAIPNSYKKEQQTGTLYLNWYEKCILAKSLASVIYTEIQESNHNNMLKNWNKWNIELTTTISFTEFLRLFKNIYVISNSPKYRSFQYRLLNRAIITNVHLCYWGKREDNLCTWCRKVKESYNHLFYECEYVKPMWEQIFHLLGFATPKLSAAKVIYNCIERKTFSVVNVISLVFKQFVYAKRCLGETISAGEFRNKFVNISNIEKYYAIANQQYDKWCKKWGNSSENGQPLQNFIENYVENMP